jgi:hypothetical protein
LSVDTNSYAERGKLTRADDIAVLRVRIRHYSFPTAGSNTGPIAGLAGELSLLRPSAALPVAIGGLVKLDSALTENPGAREFPSAFW